MYIVCFTDTHTSHSPVNEKVATMDTVIGHNELVCHKVHRHEPPVTAQPLTIIHNDDHLVVLNKPCSIPVSLCYYAPSLSLSLSLSLCPPSLALTLSLPALPHSLSIIHMHTYRSIPVVDTGTTVWCFYSEKNTI